MTAIHAAARKSVLVVDDDPRVLAALRRACGSLPYRFGWADSAESALRLLELELPALLICDYRMPGVDGMTLVERVQNRDPSVRCLLHTGEAMHRVAFSFGVRVVSKPCSAEELCGVIAELMSAA